MRLLSVFVGIVVLVGVVAGAVVVLQQSDASPDTDASPARAKSTQPAAPETGPAEPDTETLHAEGEDKVIAYYFHWTSRCHTCLEIEEYSRNVIFETFGADLEAGRLEWHAHDMELPKYEHYQRDFELSMPSLVLVHVDDGRIADWKVLSRVWDLVHTPWELEDYIKDQTQEYLANAYGHE